MRYSQQIKAKFKMATSTAEQRSSAISTLIITVIIITPLCGFLFQCGCDWPWSGLDRNCNFYQAHAQYHCPWCASMISGILSTGLAIIAGIFAATTPQHSLSYAHAVGEVSIRIIFGITVFILVAILCAGVAALLQAYPLGIGELVVA
ncbi:MAG: hypothetical protein GQ583_12035 [Methyloprofundus sp.]|nr:hypothetical protein [Methyloprofundus sp.]